MKMLSGKTWNQLLTRNCWTKQRLGRPAKAIKQRLDPKCWTGKHKEGTKIKGGIRVNNCVPNEGVEEGANTLFAVKVVDPKTGNEKTMEISALTAAEAKSKVAGRTVEVDGEKKHYKVVSVKSAWDDSIDEGDMKEDLDEGLFLESQFDMIEEMIRDFAEFHGVDEDAIWEDMESVTDEELLDEAEAWQTSKGKNKNGGLNKKGVASYRRSHPGSKLQTAVTTKPSKLKKGSKAAKRRKSFCARMKGMKKSRTSAKTARDPNSRINKSLRKWHCESVELNDILRLAGVAKVDSNT